MVVISLQCLAYHAGKVKKEPLSLVNQSSSCTHLPCTVDWLYSCSSHFPLFPCQRMSHRSRWACSFGKLNYATVLFIPHDFRHPCFIGPFFALMPHVWPFATSNTRYTIPALSRPVCMPSSGRLYGMVLAEILWLKISSSKHSNFLPSNWLRPGHSHPTDV